MQNGIDFPQKAFMDNLDRIIDFYKNDTMSASKRQIYMKSFTKSGYALISKIDPSAEILDIGCGDNLFKPYFKNLTGIDPATDLADLKLPFQYYKPDRLFDVVLCLGSIQGNQSEVYEQISKIYSILKSNGRIYWRCMPYPPPFEVPDWMSLWTFQLHKDLAKKFGFEIIELEWDIRTPPHTPRIYAQWKKI
jgi:SAM-dependent methyltransferase